MQKQEEGLLSRCQGIVRDVILAFLGNEGLFLLMAFFNSRCWTRSVFAECYEQVDAVYRYILVPWGASLCVLRLQTRSAKPRRTHGDVMALFLLYVWLDIRSIRFGMAMINLRAWFDYGACSSASMHLYPKQPRNAENYAGHFQRAAHRVRADLEQLPAVLCRDEKLSGVGAGGDVFGVLDGYL